MLSFLSFANRVGVIGTGVLCVRGRDLSRDTVGGVHQVTTFGGPRCCGTRTVQLPVCGGPHVVSAIRRARSCLNVPENYRRGLVTLLGSTGTGCAIRSGGGDNGGVSIAFGNDLQRGRIPTARTLLSRGGNILTTAATFNGAIVNSCLVSRQGIGALILIRADTLLAR